METKNNNMFLRFFSARRVFLLESSNAGLEYVCRRSLFAEKAMHLERSKDQQELRARICEDRGINFYYRKLERMKMKKRVNENELDWLAFIAPEEDMISLKQILKRYMDQRRTNFFLFGPIIMKRLHHLDLPDIAIEFFSDETLTSQFAYYTSVLVYIDLLFKHQRYEEIVRAFEYLVGLSAPAALWSRIVISAYFICLYKISSPEAFEKADKFWKEYAEMVPIGARTVQAYAAINLKKMKPDKALIVLDTFNNPLRYILTTNIQIQANIALDNWTMVRCGLIIIRKNVFRDTWDMIIKKKMEAQFEKLVERIINSTVDEELCITIGSEGNIMDGVVILNSKQVSVR